VRKLRLRNGSGCTVGSSISYDFGQLFELQTIASLFNGIEGVLFTYSFDATPGTLPPGLTLSPSGLLSGTFTASGDFDVKLTLTETVAFNGTVDFQ